MIIRPLRPSDQAGWRDLWTGYLTFYKTQVSEQVYQTTFARLIGDDPRDFNCLVAEQDGQLVGLAHYLFHRHGWRIDDVCYLQDLYAGPAVRGTGVGRALISGVYDAADQAGTPHVYWTTQQGNHTARQLYDRIGEVTEFIRYHRPE